LWRFDVVLVVVNMSVLCGVRGCGRDGRVMLRLIWSLKDGWMGQGGFQRLYVVIVVKVAQYVMK
jgi:hypothetical protein